MSIVTDLVRHWEANVSRVTRERLAAHEADLVEVEAEQTTSEAGLAGFSSPYLEDLLATSKSLNPTSSSQSLLTPYKIRSLLRQSGLVLAAETPATTVQDEELLPTPEKAHFESEAEWLVVSMATVQVYGILMKTLLDQIIPLNDDIWYWDGVLGSYTSLSLYTVQTSPLRVWDKLLDVKEAVVDARVHFHQLRDSPANVLESGRQGLSQQWREFYGMVRRSVAERSLQDIQARFLSPVARCRADATFNRNGLNRLRLRISSALGMLIDEGLRFGVNDDADISQLDAEGGRSWKGVIERSVSLMDQVTKNVLLFEDHFEDKVFRDVQEDALVVASRSDAGQPARIALRLDALLSKGIPRYGKELRLVVGECGKPSSLVRYWLPAGVLLLSSSTLLRICVNRRGELAQWIADIATTARDFWFNWVVEPVGKVIKTIRHDSNSEIAIMSRDSLKADRDSLERMVVEFARDKPYAATGGSVVTESQMADIRAKVREGDVTPVLRAYEKDLKRPFVGAVKGDLVRSLLIQVQKTKVDLEVAISGIDALLKSQELVFGFVGLTPGILVSIGCAQYLYSVFGNRKGSRQGHRARRITRVLRNMDRILYEATNDPATVNGLLSYQHRGLLVCEVHILRNLAKGIFPGDVERDFLEDLEDVMNGQHVDRQRKVLKRIRWAYAKWLQ